MSGLDALVVVGASWVGPAMLVLARVGAFLAALPVLGTRMVPMRIRAGLAALLTVVLLPVAVPDPAAWQGPPAALAVAGEVLLGLAMGFALQLVFAALVFGGQALGLGMGLGFASIVDPQNGVQVPVVSQFYVITAVLLFFAMNGHLLLVELLAESFRALPPGSGMLGAEGAGTLARWGARLIGYGVLVTLPAVTAILIVNLAFGVITRAAPQLNIFAVGFPVTLLVGIAVLGLTLPVLLARFGELLLDAAELVRAIGS